jgi:hypothetical protein
MTASKQSQDVRLVGYLKRNTVTISTKVAVSVSVHHTQHSP